MKQIFLSFWILFFFCACAQASDLKTCQQINCRDQKKYKNREEQTQCLIQKRECHKRFLEVKINELKKSGVTEDQRKKMIAAMMKAKSRSQATLKGLRAKVKITEKDLAELNQKIKDLKALPAKK